MSSISKVKEQLNTLIYLELLHMFLKGNAFKSIRGFVEFLPVNKTTGPESADGLSAAIITSRVF